MILKIFFQVSLQVCRTVLPCTHSRPAGLPGSGFFGYIWSSVCRQGKDGSQKKSVCGVGGRSLLSSTSLCGQLDLNLNGKFWESLYG